MPDLVIRGGTVVDGTGRPPLPGDVAVDGDRIASVGRLAERGRRAIDARGLLVLPGWADIHTHYDGQATWDPLLTPSSWHGVTAVIFGNCGVGFAPVRPGAEGFLINCAGRPGTPRGRWGSSIAGCWPPATRRTSP